MEQLITIYFSILTVACVIMTIVSTIQYKKLIKEDKKDQAKTKLIGAIVNGVVAVVSVIITLNYIL